MLHLNIACQTKLWENWVQLLPELIKKMIIEELINENQDRRSFLKKSFFGLALLTLMPTFSSGCHKYPDVTSPLKVFNNKEIFILTGISQAFVGGNEVGLPDPAKIGLAFDIDQFISNVSLESQKQLKQLLNIFEDFTFVFNGSIKKFTGMSMEEKQKYLESWRNSSLEFRQMAYSALKMFTLLLYYCKDETWPKIGYSGPYCLGGIQ